MWRKAYLLILLALFTCPGTALAWQGRLFCRHARCISKCCPPCDLTRYYYCL